MDERTRIRDQINRTADRVAILAIERDRIDHAHRLDSFILTTILFCAAFATTRGQPIGHADTGNVATSKVIRGIDPEFANWAELALLPGLGESAATKIVAYRETWQSTLPSMQSRVFNSSSDLQKVKGIGEKTTQRVRPFLHFPSPKDDLRH